MTTQIKPVFGDKNQIRLLQLESEYKGIEPIEYIDCDCNCPYCEAEIERCPYCGESDECQLIADECKDCKKEVIPYDVEHEIRLLKHKISK